MLHHFDDDDHGDDNVENDIYDDNDDDDADGDVDDAGNQTSAPRSTAPDSPTGT